MSKAARNRELNAEKQRIKREREEFEAKKRKIRRVTAIITGALIVLLVVVTLVGTISYNIRMNSGNYLRNEIAASSVNIDVNGAMMNYYFNDVYNTFLDYYGSYVAYYGLDTTKSLKQQEISDGESWFSYFISGAMNNVSGILSLNEAAKTDGVSLTEAEINSIKIRSDKTDEGLYGRGVKKSDIYDAKLLEALAYKYQFLKQDEFTPEQTAIESGYKANPEKYQSVDFLYYSIEWSDDGMSKEDAEITAAEFADAKDSDAFKALQRELIVKNNAEATNDEIDEKLAVYKISAYNYTADDELSEWAFGETKAGETKIITDEENSAYTVYMITKTPYRNESETVNARHILFSISSYGTAEKALKKAEDVFAMYKTGDGGEEAFAELALAYSDDVGSYYNGGLYENISEGTMVENFNDWCFNAARKTGDIEIVETDYGYHIMYFSGKGLKRWEASVSNNIISEKFSNYNEEISSKYTVEFDETVLNMIPG